MRCRFGTEKNLTQEVDEIVNKVEKAYPEGSELVIPEIISKEDHNASCLNIVHRF